MTNRLSGIVRENVVLNKTAVDSDWRFDNLCGYHLQGRLGTAEIPTRNKKTNVIQNLGPVHTHLFLLENRDFFPSALAYRPHVSHENGHRRRIFLNTLSRVEIFENAGFSFACGRKKTKVFEYDDVIYHILLALRTLRKACYPISIVVTFDVDGWKRFAYATCGRNLRGGHTRCIMLLTGKHNRFHKLVVQA